MSASATGTKTSNRKAARRMARARADEIRAKTAVMKRGTLLTSKTKTKKKKK